MRKTKNPPHEPRQRNRKRSPKTTIHNRIWVAVIHDLVRDWIPLGALESVLQANQCVASRVPRYSCKELERYAQSVVKRVEEAWKHRDGDRLKLDQPTRVGNPKQTLRLLQKRRRED